MSAAEKPYGLPPRRARHSLRAAAGSVLVEELAEAAWRVLNHDNDPTDGEEHNTANWDTLCGKLRSVLKKHRLPQNAKLSGGEKEKA